MAGQIPVEQGVGGGGGINSNLNLNNGGGNHFIKPLLFLLALGWLSLMYLG